MIVRIATERQYRIPDEIAGRLNELDNATVEACEAGDEQRFQQLFNEMLTLVRRDGQLVEEDELTASEIILPPPDLTFDEARSEFTGEGLIPD